MKSPAFIAGGDAFKRGWKITQCPAMYSGEDKKQWMSGFLEGRNGAATPVVVIKPVVKETYGITRVELPPEPQPVFEMFPSVHEASPAVVAAPIEESRYDDEVDGEGEPEDAVVLQNAAQIPEPEPVVLQPATHIGPRGGEATKSAEVRASENALYQRKYQAKKRIEKLEAEGKPVSNELRQRAEDGITPAPEIAAARPHGTKVPDAEREANRIAGNKHWAKHRIEELRKNGYAAPPELLARAEDGVTGAPKITMELLEKLDQRPAEPKAAPAPPPEPAPIMSDKALEKELKIEGARLDAAAARIKVTMEKHAETLPAAHAPLESEIDIRIDEMKRTIKTLESLGSFKYSDLIFHFNAILSGMEYARSMLEPGGAVLLLRFTEAEASKMVAAAVLDRQPTDVWAKETLLSYTECALEGHYADQL